MPLSANQARAARRIKAYRDLQGRNQEELAAAMGFENRQTLSSIESLERPISARELALAAKALDLPVETLVDPFLLVGEGEFNFRADTDGETINEFEIAAGRWVATYRELRTQLRIDTRPLAWKLDITETSSFEDVWGCAHNLWTYWSLGEVPAIRLEQAMTEQMDLLVLYVDAPAGISGAAINVPNSQTIIINRNESEGRRSFDMAHELFHVLTWDRLRPKRVEATEIPRVKGNRVEQLANTFAAALLMPAQIITSRWASRTTGIREWISATAGYLRVSAKTLGWRLVNLSLIAIEEWKRLQDSVVSAMGTGQAPLLFSRRFVELVRNAIEAGLVSLRKAASLLCLTVDGLVDLCADHGVPLASETGA